MTCRVGMTAILLGGLLAGCDGSDRARTERGSCGPPPPLETPLAPGDVHARARPAWHADAKLGVMIHWGLYSVPAWADPSLDPEVWLGNPALILLAGNAYFPRNPYAEWYANTMAIEGSPTAAHHAAVHGDTPYEAFRDPFEAAAAAWDASTWADLFAEAGARYVVLVTKHHDGYALWPSDVPHPRTGDRWRSERDYLGDLAGAVRERCMRMGVYYSGGIDWSFDDTVLRSFVQIATSTPTGADYAAYADAHYRELIRRYRPAVLWNDINYPPSSDLDALFADYYTEVPDGVVNDRWTLLRTSHVDYGTPEYAVPDEILDEPFETVRGVGRSFGYNRNEDPSSFLSGSELVHLLVDVVSKNGNLLINVGPRPDGSIQEEQAEPLRALGRWLEVHGRSIFGTRPWTRFGGTTEDGLRHRFTVDDDTLYVHLLDRPTGATLRLTDLPPIRRADLLGHGPVEITRRSDATTVAWPTDLAPGPVHVLALGL